MTLAPIENHGSIELAAHVEPGQNLITWARALGSAHQIASALCTTAFVPRHFAGKPEEAAAALMLGDELGLAPVSALRSIFVIGGTPGMYARTMVALVQSRGHDVWTETETATKVVVCGRRAGSDKVERSEWTIDRARRAGYTNNKKYETSPEDMLYARAASTVCRRIAADVLSGIPYSVEELELEEKPKATKVQRAPKPQPVEPDLEPAGPPPTEPLMLNTSSALAKAMYAAIREHGIGKDEAKDLYMAVTGREVESSKELTEDEARAVLRALDDREKDTPLIDVTDAEVDEEPAQ